MKQLPDRDKAEYYHRCYKAVDGLWFVKAEDKYSFEDALDIDLEVWKVMPKIQARFIKKKLGKDSGLDDLMDCLTQKLLMDEFKFEAKKITDIAGVERTVKQYAEADVSVIDEECAGGCQACADVCPSGAITIPEKSDKGWESVPNVVVDSEKCIACGACDNACPTGAVKLSIKEVKTSGEFSELFWEPCLERLKTLRWSETKEE